MTESGARVDALAIRERQLATYLRLGSFALPIAGVGLVAALIYDRFLVADLLLSVGGIWFLFNWRGRLSGKLDRVTRELRRVSARR